MGEAERTASRQDEAGGGKAAARLNRLVAQARAAVLWERVWPIAWRGLAVFLLFLAASWAGLWLALTPGWRVAGVIAFALAFAAALAPLVRLPVSSRRQVLARIDRDATRAGLGLHDPASTVEDTLALGQADPESRALWALHQRRANTAIARLRVARPDPDMPRHDPLALRAGVLVAAVAALFVAGAEWPERVSAAFDWQTPRGPGPDFRVDGWINPPLYTRLPPLIIALDGTEQRLRAPAGSILVVRVAGGGAAKLVPNAALEPVVAETEDAQTEARPASRPPVSKPGSPDLREERFRLAGGTAELTIEVEGGSTQHLVVETIPDRPPEVKQVGGLEINGRGTFNLTYRAKDDYGLASAEAVVVPLKEGRTLVPPPRLALALPADATGETDTKTLLDLTDHPWAGARARMNVVVKDEAGQEGRTEPAELKLPGRIFAQALARSLAEERSRLVLGPDTDRARVQTALDALLIAPDTFTPQANVYLGLETASRRLRTAKTDEDLIGVADLLWEMALKIEDGDLSDAEKALRAAQDRLKEAIDRSAPDEEIKKLADDLKQALDRFVKEFAERQRQTPQKQREQGQEPQQNAKSVTPEDLNKMLQDMQEAMKRGDTAEAQRLLEELRNVLENLKNAQTAKSPEGAGMAEMKRQMQELDQLSREQQDLRDQTYQDGQQKGGEPRRPPQRQGRNEGGQPQNQSGQQDSGQKGAQGQKPGQQGQGGAGQRQQALRERLESLQRDMKERGMQGEQGLSDAENAMREAENALRQGQEGQAVDAQGRALDGLKRGAEGMQQQMAEAEGQGEGEGQQEGGPSASRQGQAGAGDDDPLGRPTKGRDISDGRVRVPGADESAVQRARRIMDELRRKLGDPTRPPEELDYFERLLRRN